MTESPESKHLALLAAEAAESKKASDVLIIDVKPTLAIVDYFIIATAPTGRHLSAIAEAIEERLREEAGRKPLGREGMEWLNWILLDYGDIVVHLFLPQVREFYRLENLFNDATFLRLPHGAHE
ncbi:MAG: ribosome silencing factor [Coriobacteriales bacterium]|nr:ribosome silencing factor [Coriobacteriales bacterium]